MQFTTKIPITKFQNSISYESKILSLGSCFAENMGKKLKYYKFEITAFTTITSLLTYVLISINLNVE